MSGMRILVVCEDASSRAKITGHLEAAGKGYVVTPAAGMDAVPIYMTPPAPDLVVLGCTFAHDEGAWLAGCRRLRTLDPSGTMGILVIAAGLPPGAASDAGAAGADGCLASETLTRLSLHDAARRVLRHVARRRKGLAKAGPLTLHRAGREVRAEGQRIPLSARRFEFFWLLATARGSVVPYAELGDDVHAVQEMARCVRSSLGVWGYLIVNERSVGYRLGLGSTLALSEEFSAA